VFYTQHLPHYLARGGHCKNCTKELKKVSTTDECLVHQRRDFKGIFRNSRRISMILLTPSVIPRWCPDQPLPLTDQRPVMSMDGGPQTTHHRWASSSKARPWPKEGHFTGTGQDWLVSIPGKH